ncbi:uncharacterized protein LOC122922894 isoform X1 [Bufo gargarizans]|uniref:uncharacterized protein LOC122922894 isoform X1 n=1 Tax=Bufo gargarizans TaxID=30331 RepID=UPI001CF398C7|nr:uncharacterized protein LOC122922894 isoform X1 [Bufo gargarizans]
MWKILYLTVIGVFILVINGQDYDIEKMEKCPCANDVIGAFLESVNKNDLEVDNGQKLKLRLWKQRNDNCTAHVLNKSPKPGQIEIRMVYHGSVYTEAQGQGQDVGDQNGGVDIGQQQDMDNGQQQDMDNGPQQDMDNGPQQDMDNGQQQDMDNGQQQDMDNGQQQDMDNGQQQDMDNGQQQGAEDTGLLQDKDIEQLLANTYLEQLQQSMRLLEQIMDVGQEQAGVDTEQEQSQLLNGLGNGSENNDYSAEFIFTVDVNTGKLTDSTGSMTGEKRRKREIMPFETVIISITVKYEKKQHSDVGASNDQIKLLLRNALDDYWLKMTFCLLDVQQ